MLKRLPLPPLLLLPPPPLLRLVTQCSPFHSATPSQPTGNTQPLPPPPSTQLTQPCTQTWTSNNSWRLNVNSMLKQQRTPLLSPPHSLLSLQLRVPALTLPLPHLERRELTQTWATCPCSTRLAFRATLMDFTTQPPICPNLPSSNFDPKFHFISLPNTSSPPDELRCERLPPPGSSPLGALSSFYDDQGGGSPFPCPLSPQSPEPLLVCLGREPTTAPLALACLQRVLAQPRARERHCDQEDAQRERCCWQQAVVRGCRGRFYQRLEEQEVPRGRSYSTPSSQHRTRGTPVVHLRRLSMVITVRRRLVSTRPSRSTLMPLSRGRRLASRSSRPCFSSSTRDTDNPSCLKNHHLWLECLPPLLPLKPHRFFYSLLPIFRFIM
ncbi:hypothetical protein T439DRAFT_134414 [Meredithblackwellia eburnea MCA 4105]